MHITYFRFSPANKVFSPLTTQKVRIEYSPKPNLLFCPDKGFEQCIQLIVFDQKAVVTERRVDQPQLAIRNIFVQKDLFRNRKQNIR